MYIVKSGDIRIPATLGCIIFSLLFLIWMVSNKKDLKYIFLGSSIKRVGIFYLIYSFLIYSFSDFSEHGYIGRIAAHYIVYGGYLLAFYFALDMKRYGRGIISPVIKIVVISMAIISLYALLQVFFDSEKIALAGISEIYGAPAEPLISRTHGAYNVLEGSASMKNSIFLYNNFTGRKVFSTFLHGNIFGGHLVLFYPLILSLLCTAVKRKKKIIYFGLAVIIILSLLFTNSRAALIGFLVSCLCLFLLSREKKKAILFLISVLLSGIMFFCLILGIAERYDLKITSGDARSYRRFIVQDRYKVIFEMPRLIKKKMMSLGKPAEIEEDADCKLNEATNYRYKDFEKFGDGFFGKKNIRYLIFGRGYTGMYVYQNLYLNLLYNLGIAGFSIFLYIIIHILRMSIKSGGVFYRTSIEARVLVMGGVSGIAGFLTHNLFDNLFYFPPIGLNFWILCGLVLMAADYREKPLRGHEKN